MLSASARPTHVGTCATYVSAVIIALYYFLYMKTPSWNETEQLNSARNDQI